MIKAQGNAAMIKAQGNAAMKQLLRHVGPWDETRGWIDNLL